MKRIVGVDLGGTNIKLAVLEPGRVLLSTSCSTDVAGGPTRVCQQIAVGVNQLLQQADLCWSDIAGIGVGVPGLIDSHQGLVHFSPNLFWHEVPFRDMLQRQFPVPVFIDNDVRVATLGEYLHGAGKGHSLLICVMLGTGIGSGIVYQGQLLRGSKEATGEVGHMTIVPGGPRCNCGKQGCLEALSSARAVRERAIQELMHGASSVLREWVDGELELVTAKMVAEAALKQDPLARQILNDAGSYLGIGLANYANILNPELIIIGGGLAEAGPPLWQPMRQAFAQHAMSVQRECVTIVKAQHGPWAGVIGAAALVEQRSPLL